MKNIFKNYRTSLAGLALIFGGLANAAGEFQTGGLGAVNLAVLFTAITGGIGLILGKDAAVTGATPPVK